MMHTWATRRTQRGFTMVELLIVIVVIAILAAITIVSYNGISSSAKASAAASAAEQAAKKVLNYATLNSEQFPGLLANADVIDDAHTTYEYSYDNNARTYCITATFQSVSAYIASGTSVATPGLCPGHTGVVFSPNSDRLVRVTEFKTAGTSPVTVNFTEATPLDDTHLLVAIVAASTNSMALTAAGWTELTASGMGSGWQLRVFARQADGVVNGISVTGLQWNGRHIVLLAFKGFSSLTPIVQNSGGNSSNVLTATLSLPSTPAAYGVTIGAVMGYAVSGSPSIPDAWGSWPAGFTPNTSPGPLYPTYTSPAPWTVRSEYDGVASAEPTITWTGGMRQRWVNVVMPLTP